MLLKELLEILPGNQRVKIVYIISDSLKEVKGTSAIITNNHEYLLNEPVSVAYTKANILSICL